MTPAAPLPDRPLPYATPPSRRQRTVAGVAAGVVSLLVLGTALLWAGALGARAVLDQAFGPGSNVTGDPRAWFEERRDEFDAAAAWAESTCCLDPYYGDALPDSLDHLTENGRVATADGPTGGPEAFFFVQWLGMPDDAGGYWWSPGGSPSGQDMFGMACRQPVDLGGGWWMCGL